MRHVVSLFLEVFIIHERHRKTETERGRHTDRGRSSPHAESPRQDLILGLQDQGLGRRQALNHWVTRHPLKALF